MRIADRLILDGEKVWSTVGPVFFLSSLRMVLRVTRDVPQSTWHAVHAIQSC